MKTNKLRFWVVILAVVVLDGIGRATALAAPQVYAGPCAFSSFLVDGAGTLNAWGKNGFGCLGVGSPVALASPSAVPFPVGVHSWRAVTTASGFNGDWTYAIGDDLQMYGAGDISFNFYNYLTLVPPPAGAGGWASVAANDYGWLAISTNGSIYGVMNGTIAWPPRAGATSWKQIAVCSYFSSTQPDLFALDDRGKLFGFYSGTAWFPSPTFVEIPVPAGATAWTNLSGGGLHLLALANDGNLYGLGHNESGQLGQGQGFVYTNVPQRIALPAGKSGWKMISAGGRHSLATTTDGQLFGWGSDYYGQLGLGNNTQNQYAPVAVPELTNVTTIAAGYYHSLAVVDCRVLAWGYNANGQLGAGFNSSYYPLPIDTQFTYDICSTNPPALPLVSITVADPYASEGTWLSTLGEPATNTGRFEISRAVTTPASLQVQLSVSGTALNGVDYFALPASVTIPANSNSVSLFVVPTGSTLAADPSTVTVNPLPDAAYQLANSVNATVTLIQYEAPATNSLPFPTLSMRLFVGTNLNGQVFLIQASTNLVDWTDLGTGVNNWGIVTVAETNRTYFRQRFFRALPVAGQ